MKLPNEIAIELLTSQVNALSAMCDALRAANAHHEAVIRRLTEIIAKFDDPSAEGKPADAVNFDDTQSPGLTD